MADSGWKTPDMVDMMLKMCSWLPLIHIMKHSSPTLLNAPVAFSTSAWQEGSGYQVSVGVGGCTHVGHILSTFSGFKLSQCRIRRKGVRSQSGACSPPAWPSA